MKHYRYGIKKEDLLAAFVKRRGWIPYYAPGSRGPYDLAAKRGKRRMFIQMKSTRKHLADEEQALTHALSAFSRRDQNRLIRTANLNRAIPLLALSSGHYVWIWNPTGGEFQLVHHGWLPKRPLRRS